MNKEVKFETLHKKINLKCVVIGVLVVTLIVLVIVNRASHAAYTSNLNVPLVNGKINYKHPDFKVMAMYVQESSGNSTYNETNTMPSGNDYVINEDKSYCNKGNTSEKDSGVILKTVNGNHVMNNLTKNDRCFLYFDESYNVASILAKYTKDDSRSGEIKMGYEKETPTTVYSKDDDDGTSYMFAGVNPNNWVKIDNIYFRIIRFNGNGSMRLIYSGSGSAQAYGEGSQIGKKAFNTNYNDNMYVGLQYTSGQVHGNSINSTILGETNTTDTTTLYGWYNANIKDIYGSFIDSNVGFCNDRDNYTDGDGTTSGGGTGTTVTYYGALVRYGKYSSEEYTYTPTLKCKNTTDLLKLPVGLITIDEYMLAGGNTIEYYSGSLWLNAGIGADYWTMSPYNFSGSSAQVAYVWGHYNCITVGNVSGTSGVRPVINLKSNTIFESNGADGSSSKPYVVKAP